MVTFDIATKIIPNEHKIWALHAGRGKRQYDVFEQSERVFLEMPGIIPPADAFDNVGQVRRFLRLSNAIYRFVSGATEHIPSRNLNSYSDGPADPKDRLEKGMNASLGNLVSLYSEANVGDLVIVPGIGQYKPVLIGEIVAPYSPDDAIVLESLGGESVPTRKVRWIKKSIEKRQFSRPLAKRLENRHAIINIRDQLVEGHIGQLSKEVYRSVYDSYVLLNESKITLYGRDYNSKNPDGIIASAQVVKFLVAAMVANQRGEMDAFSNMLPEHAVAVYYDARAIQDFTFNFNSPGKMEIVAGIMFAIIIGLGITAGVEGVTFDDIQNGVELINSGAAQVPDEIGQCGEIYQGIMNSIGEGGFNYIQEQCALGHNEIGLETPMRKVN